MKFKYMTKKDTERNMTEECQSLSEAKYTTETETMIKQVCKGVHSRVEYRDMAGQEYKHGHGHGERLETAGLGEQGDQVG